MVLGQDRTESSSSQPAETSGRRGKGKASAPATELDDDGGALARGKGSLEDRVARLEREVVALRGQLAMRGRVAVSGSGAAPGSIADDPVLEGEVRGIYEQEREREREQQQEIRRERAEEMRIASLDELVQAASLNDEQRESIDGLWTTESDKMLPLFESMRGGDRSFTDIREQVRTIRKETDDAARALLSDAQFESYEELRPRGGRGGRDRGPPGGPPPG
jgi:hypothetical protein